MASIFGFDNFVLECLKLAKVYLSISFFFLVESRGILELICASLFFFCLFLFSRDSLFPFSKIKIILEKQHTIKMYHMRLSKSNSNMTSGSDCY